MEPIHNRIPVILHRRDYERWLAPTDPAHLPIDLLRPFPAEDMKAWKVGRAVGNTRNNDPSLIAPVKADESVSQLSLL
jgi:putative SOS response-associated peptidase YedK